MLSGKISEKWRVQIHFNVILQVCCDLILFGSSKLAYAVGALSWIHHVFILLWLDSVGKSVNTAFRFPFLSFPETKKPKTQTEWTVWMKHTEILFWKSLLLVWVLSFLGYEELYQLMVAVPFPYPNKCIHGKNWERWLLHQWVSLDTVGTRSCSSCFCFAIWCLG